MARDYRELIRGPGIWVPRWLIVMIVLLLACWFASRIFLPPMWVVQQLDAPDGARSARLLRSVHMEHHFVVKLKEDWFWQTAYLSPPITNDFRVDLGEALRWSEDAQKVYLKIEDEPVWGYDFEARRRLTPDELQEWEH